MRKKIISVGAIGAVALVGIAPAASAASFTPSPGPSKAGNAHGCVIPVEIAHRFGVPPLPPLQLEPQTPVENSMSGLALAKAEKAPLVETDIVISKDGVPYIMHDRTLFRTVFIEGPHADTMGTIDVGDLNWNTDTTIEGVAYPPVKNLKLYNNSESIPTLDDVTTFVKDNDMLLVAEYKDKEDPTNYGIYYDSLAASGAKFFVSGFSRPLMAWANAKSDSGFKGLMWFDIGYGLAPAGVPANAFAGVNQLGALGPNPLFVNQMRSAGKFVNFWYNAGAFAPDTVDNPTYWTAAAKAGATWISTDYPARFASWAKTTSFCKTTPKPVVSKPQTLRVTVKTAVKRSKNKTYVLVAKTPKTNANQAVTIKSSKSKVGKVTIKGGKVSLKSNGKKGTIKLTFSAKAKTGFKALTKAFTVKVK